MSVFFLNMPFAIEKRIPFPLCPAIWIGDQFDNKRYGANKTFYLVTRHFICAPNLRSVKRDAARTRKKFASSKLIPKSRSKFDPHRHWRRKLRCVNILAKGWSHRDLIWGQNKICPIYNAQIFWRTEQFTSYRLLSKQSLIHFARESGKGIMIFTQKLRVQIVKKPRSPRSETIT
jgi:hypothetical protein